MSESASKIDMTGEEALDVIRELGRKTTEIVKAEIDMERQHASYKSAKAHVEELKEERDQLYSELTETLSDRPLFRDKEPEASKAPDEPKVAAVATEWRQEPISVLLSHGATQKDIDKLIEADVKDLGALADCPDLTAIRGIGPAAADRIADAAANYHTSNADGPDEDDDDEDEGPILEVISDEDDELPIEQRPQVPYRVSFPKSKKRPAVFLWASLPEDAEDYALVNFEHVEKVERVDPDMIPDGVRVQSVPAGYAKGLPLPEADPGAEPEAGEAESEVLDVEFEEIDDIDPEDESQETPDED